MGLLKSIGNAVGGVVNTVTDTIGLTTPQSVQNAQSQAQAVQNEQIRKQQEYQKKLGKEAEAFRGNLPGYKEEQGRISEDSGKRQLARDLSGNDKSFASRGLLYSGLRNEGAANAHTDFYATQAGERAKINAQAEDLARGMEEKALGMGFDVQSQAQANSDRAYDTALQQRMGQNQAIGNLLGGVGGLLGKAAGSKVSPTSATPTIDYSGAYTGQAGNSYGNYAGYA